MGDSIIPFEIPKVDAADSEGAIEVEDDFDIGGRAITGNPLAAAIIVRLGENIADAAQATAVDGAGDGRVRAATHRNRSGTWLNDDGRVGGSGHGYCCECREGQDCFNLLVHFNYLGCVCFFSWVGFADLRLLHNRIHNINHVNRGTLQRIFNCFPCGWYW